MIFAFIVPLMDERHLPGAGFFFTFDAAMFFLVRAVGGRWSDRFGRWRVLIPGMAVCGLSMTILTAVPLFPAFVVAALLWGGAISIVLPELNALAVDLVPPARRGAALATSTGVFEAGLALSGLAFGWLADWLSLPFIFGLAASLYFVTAAVLWLRYGRRGLSHRGTEDTEREEKREDREQEFHFSLHLFSVPPLCSLCPLWLNPLRRFADDGEDGGGLFVAAEGGHHVDALHEVFAPPRSVPARRRCRRGDHRCPASAMRCRMRSVRTMPGTSLCRNSAWRVFCKGRMPSNTGIGIGP